MALDYTNTSEHYIPVPAITDKFSYSRDMDSLRQIVSKMGAGLAAQDSSADNYMFAAANAGTHISASEAAPKGRIAGLASGDDAKLMFQDNDGAALTDVVTVGFDDSANAFIIHTATDFDATLANNDFSINLASGDVIFGQDVRAEGTLVLGGGARTEGVLQINPGDAGAVTASTNADEVVIESAGTGGQSILGPDASNQNLYFGSPSDSVGAFVRWNFNALTMTISSNRASADMVLQSGNSVTALTFNSDQTADFAGSVGIGGVRTEGVLQINPGDAGAVTAHTSVDDLVVEGAGNMGMSMLCPDASTSRIYFGTPSDNNGAIIQWAHTGTAMKLGTGITGGTLILTSDTFTTQMTIAADGGVVFANLLAAAASTDLNINGSNEIHSVTSSAFYKDDIRGMELDSARIFDLTPRTFDWNECSGDPGMVDFGLVAEEVYEIYPELVNMRKGAPYSVRYTMLPVLMLDQMRELRRRIEELEHGKAA